MRSSRGALCALVVVGSLLVVASAWGPFDSRNAQAVTVKAPEVEVIAQEAPVRPVLPLPLQVFPFLAAILLAHC